MKKRTANARTENRVSDSDRDALADESQLPEFGWGGAAGAYYFIDLKNGITAYFATHVLGYERFQQARGIITDIVEKILN